MPYDPDNNPAIGLQAPELHEAFGQTLPSNKPEPLQNAQLMPIGFLYPNSFPLRVENDQRSLDELTASIKDVGVLEPLLVIRKGRKHYILIAGHRRLEAAKRAELTAVPCIVLDLSQEDFLLYSLIENLQRSDLEPMEEARAIKQLIEQLGLTYRDIATKIGKSASFVNDRLSLLLLPADLKKAIADKTLSLKKALALSKIPIERLRAKLILRGASLDLEQFKQLIDDEIIRRKQKRNPNEKWDVLPELKQFAKANDSVHIFKNRISLRYDSLDSLRQLLSELENILSTYDVEN